MKPVIIYGMPRSRTGAILQSCKRSVKINEPLRPHNLHPGVNELTRVQRYAELNARITVDYWQNLVHSMSNSDSATKIFGIDLFYYIPGRQWLEQCVNDNSHDIFIIERDREETVLSYFLARHFGFRKTYEIEPHEIEIEDTAFYVISLFIDHHIRFMPNRGQVIRFENLPASHFDVNNNQHIRNQHSNLKYSYIKNLDEIRSRIQVMLSYFKDEWDTALNNVMPQ